MAAMGRTGFKGALCMAEGGKVDDDDLSKPSFRKPLIAKRREDRQDRKGSADAPLSVARGLVAGSLGLPGDVEKIARWAAQKAGKDVDQSSFLPTSEELTVSLPLRAAESKGRGAWESLGSMVSPAPGAAVAKPVAKLAGKEALRAVDKAMMGEAKGPLSALVAPSQPMNVVPKDLRFQASPFSDYAAKHIFGGDINSATKLEEDLRNLSRMTNEQGVEYGARQLIGSYEKTKALPYARGDKEGVMAPTISEAFGKIYGPDWSNLSSDTIMTKSPRMFQTLDLHTHPGDNTIFPSGPGFSAGGPQSVGDIGAWYQRKAGDATSVDDPYHMIIGRPWGKQLGYSASQVKDTSLLHPEAGGIVKGAAAIREGVNKGAYDDVIAQYVDEMNTFGMSPEGLKNNIRNGQFFLPHIFLEERGASKMAYDPNSGIDEFYNVIAPRTYELVDSVLPNMKKTDYKLGGHVRGPLSY
jgi:hypothetical protein